MSNKKGMALYVYKILLELVVVILIIATILGIINTCSSNTEESAKDNFELLAGVMDSFVQNDKEFVSVQIFVPEDNYLVAFDNPWVGPIVKPTSCYDARGEYACLCLYNADPFQNIDAAKRDNGVVEECEQIGQTTDTIRFSRIISTGELDNLPDSLRYNSRALTIPVVQGESSGAKWFVYAHIFDKPVHQIVLVKTRIPGSITVTAYYALAHTNPVLYCDASPGACGEVDVMAENENEYVSRLNGCFGYICEQPQEYCIHAREADIHEVDCWDELYIYEATTLGIRAVQIDNTIACGTYQAYYNQRTPNDPDDFVIAYGAQCPVDQTCVFSRLLPNGGVTLPSGQPQSIESYPIKETDSGNYLNYVGVWEGECKPTS